MGETPPSSRQCHGKAASKQLVSAASAGWGRGLQRGLIADNYLGFCLPDPYKVFPFFHTVSLGGSQGLLDTPGAQKARSLLC